MSDEQQVEKSETEHAPDSYRILVVDDDDAFRDSLQAVLQQACYQVEAIDSPQAALEFVANQSFDIVISDFKMPDMNGIEFIREGLKRTPESAMVLMTAYGNFELAVQALREGAYDLSLIHI